MSRARTARRPRPSRSTSTRACSRRILIAAGYFAEEVRRELGDRYGEKKLYEGGLSVRTTLDPKMQLMARKAWSTASCATTRRMASAARCGTIDISQDWGLALADVPALGDVAPWRLAVVLDATRGRRRASVCSRGARNPARSNANARRAR